MKAMKLFEAIGEIDDGLVFAAANDPGRKKRAHWVRWVAMAACIALAVFAGISFIPGKEPGGEQPELPMISTDVFINAVGSGGGMTDCYAYDISELVNANPWTPDTELETLPVFKNTLEYNEMREVANPNFEAMEAVLSETAAALGVKGETLKTGSSVSVETEGVKIYVGAGLSVRITFEPAANIPDRYVFTSNAACDELSDFAKYFRREYGTLPGVKNAEINVWGGERNFRVPEEQSYYVSLFEKGKTLEEKIVNYSFNTVELYCDELGLHTVWINRPDLSQKMGDYPLITLEEAKDLLLAGEYIDRGVTNPIAGEEYIRKVELIYDTYDMAKYYLPYYCFYVEIPGTEQNGLTGFDTFLVPAVNGKYIRK